MRAGRAQAAELARREACPAREGAREMRRIGVPEVQRDVDDLACRIVEHLLRNGEAGLRDDTHERGPLVGEPPLERPGAQLHHLRDRADFRAPVGEQRGDDLLHDANVLAGARIVSRRRSSRVRRHLARKAGAIAGILPSARLEGKEMSDLGAWTLPIW